ncbi:MAG: hypothetical protein VX252_05225 [Myxococcota bacterium]|nr:hypothetical protein [Myxococcota bacterium]
MCRSRAIRAVKNFIRETTGQSCLGVGSDPEPSTGVLVVLTLVGFRA